MPRRYRFVFIVSILAGLTASASASAATYTQVATYAGGSSSTVFSGPYGLALSPSGDLIVADSGHHQIKKISPAGVVSVLAGTGDLGDRDGAATFAQFKNPVAVAVDGPRNLIYVADTQSDSIRKIAADGTVSTFAATGFADPMGLAVDAGGNVYVADSGNNKIKKITPAGMVTTIAGTGQAAYLDQANALFAKFNQPNGLAIASNGVLYIADQKNHAIRKLENGAVSTVAGNGTNGWVDGAAASAKFREPRGIAFDADGNLLIADSNNNLVRLLTFGASPTVSTLAGTGAAGFVDGVPSNAKFREPAAIVVAGSVYIADAGNNAVRVMVAAPAIASVSPNRGPTVGGNIVHVHGGGFVVAQTQVSFGFNAATNVTVNSDSDVSVTVPAGISGSADVIVTTPAGTATLSGGYTYLAPPAVAAIQPAKGPAAGGTTVSITGSSFSSDAAVMIGAAAATAVSVSGTTQIGATTPAGTAGLADVAVNTAGGTSVLHNGYNYFAAPFIANFSPAQGSPGTIVTINGANFDPVAAGNVVLFGALATPANAATSTQLIVTVPNGTAAGRITVTTAGGSATSAAEFTTAAVVAVEITAPATSLAQTDRLAFNAIARSSDGSIRDVTQQAAWTSSSANVATVSVTGVVTGVAAGTAAIGASFSGFSDSKTVTVSAATIPFIAATPLDPTIVQPIADTIRFLYDGPNAVQIGVAAGAIADNRAAVVGGIVLDTAGAPLPGVQVIASRHGELGRTLTRADGRYDFVLNGGGVTHLLFSKAGFINCERIVTTKWNQQRTIGDVVLVAFDAAVSPIAMNAAADQVARGSAMTDSDGTRRATLIFPAGMNATITDPDGSTEPAATLHVRATEFTVGANGPKAMPAILPAASGYTYCVELSADEAPNGATIRFTKPFALYLENFLDFPVGTIVPVGYFDRATEQWIASPNGVVLKVLAVNGGVASLDTDGDNAADSQSRLTSLGIDAAELAQLGALYTAGQTLWRSSLDHFTPFDDNWSFVAPSDALAPAVPKPAATVVVTNGTNCPGSIVNCENQRLGESIPITGTPYSLEYDSSRTDKTSYQIDVAVTPASIAPSLKSVTVNIAIAGRSITQVLATSPNQKVTFVWDGLDEFGRQVQGSRNADVTVSYVYAAKYIQASTSASGEAFNSPSRTLQVLSNRERAEISLSEAWNVPLGHHSAAGTGFGAWSFNAQRAYDSIGRTLYEPGATERSSDAKRIEESMLQRVAGNGGCCDATWTAPATGVAIDFPTSVAPAPDGGFYFAAFSAVYRVDPAGALSIVAGSTANNFRRGFTADGAVAAGSLVEPFAVALSPDGIVYFTESASNNFRVRRIANGRLETVAGGNVPASTGANNGDGGPATAAKLFGPIGLAFAPDGTLYVDDNNVSIRRITPDGTISTIAGASTGGVANEVPATQTRIDARSIAVASDGSVYLVETNTLRRITPDGIIHLVAGSTSTSDLLADGTSLTTGTLADPFGLAVGGDGTVLIYERGRFPRNAAVRAISGGTITTLAGAPAGGNSFAPPAEGILARAATLGNSFDVRIGPDGSAFIAQYDTGTIFKSQPLFPVLNPSAATIIPSDSGAVAYVFENGRHTRTVSTLTGTTLETLAYDSRGFLISITDIDGQTTSIERDGTGVATAIVAPGGQRTTIHVGASGLSNIQSPSGDTYDFEYNTLGLLSKLTDPRRGVHKFTYDDVGRLVKDEDPAGGFLSFVRSGEGSNFTVTRSSAEGQTTSFGYTTDASLQIFRVITPPSGLMLHTFEGTDGSMSRTTPDGVTTQMKTSPDPRFGMTSPFVSSASIHMPSGLGLSMTATRQVVLANSLDPLSLTSLTDTTKVNGRTFTSAFTPANRTLTLTSPLGKHMTAVLDTHDRLSTVQVPGLTPISLAYEAHGLVTTVFRGGRQSSMTYDAKLRVATITTPPLGTVSFEYDDADRVTRETLTDGRTVSFAYDAAGNVVSVTPSARQAHSFAFTPVDRISDYTPPTATNSAGSMSYQYDRDRRLTIITRLDGSTINIGYDAAGRMASMTEPTGTHSFVYDAATGDLVSASMPGGVTARIGYDGALLTEMGWSGEVSGGVGFTYDSNLRLAGQLVGSSNTPFAYDNDDLLTSAGALTLHHDSSNGLLTGTTLGIASDAYTYNGFGEVSSYDLAVSGSSVFGINYTRDDAGRITQKSETINGVTSTTAYSYDAAGHLSDVVVDGTNAAHYDYDDNGNRLHRVTPTATEAGTYDAQDRVTTYNGITYTYTPDGELRTKTDTNGTTAYTYDVLGNLRRVVLPNADVIDYVIDGLNRRVGKKINGTMVKGWLYADQLRPVAELDGSGTVVSTFVYATRSNVPVFMTRGGTTYRIISDHLGSPRFILDSGTNTLAETLTYDEFGNVLSDSNPGFQPFGFAGGLYDSNAGLVRFGARDYDPRVGRWTTKDPILFAGGDTNLFGYVANDPINYFDPRGLEHVQEPEFTKPLSAANWSDAPGIVQASFYAEGILTLISLPETVVDFVSDVWAARRVLRRPANSCSYGSTPGGVPYTRHYGTETGPERNIPGSIVDETLRRVEGVPGRDNTTIYYDPDNDVTVVMGQRGVMSVHKGAP